MKKILICLFFMCIIFSACTSVTQTMEISKKSSEFTVGVLLKSMNNQHWMDIRTGILDAANSFDVDVILLYPENEAAVEQQKMMFKDLVTAKPDIIIVAPCDSENCKEFVEQANEIPLLTLDTRAEDVFLPYVGADNEKIGKLAAQRLATRIDEEAKIAIISGVETQASHRERIKGFTDEIKKSTKLTIEKIAYADSNYSIAMQKMDEIMQEFSDVEAVFCTSAVMGLGAIEQKKRRYYEVDPLIIAVDTQDDALVSLQMGKLDSLITQSGYEAGYKVIIAAVNMLKGVTTEDNIYINTELLTRDNVDEFIANELKNRW